MSVTVDANVLLYASDAQSPRHRSARDLLERLAADEAPVGSDVIRGNLVTDSHIAALMRQHGVGVIWTADRDFRRFPDLTARDPYSDVGD